MITPIKKTLIGMAWLGLAYALRHTEPLLAVALMLGAYALIWSYNHPANAVVYAPFVLYTGLAEAYGGLSHPPLWVYTLAVFLTLLDYVIERRGYYGK